MHEPIPINRQNGFLVNNLTDGPVLCHHGVMGMHWGVRRYQNKDGTLTPAGRRRYAKLEEREAKAKAEKNKLKPEDPNAPKPKRPSQMTDEELRERNSRMELELRYRDNMSKLYPKTKSLLDGRSIASKILTDSVTSVGTDAAKWAMSKGINALGKALGVDDPIIGKGGDKKKDSGESKPAKSKTQIKNEEMAETIKNLQLKKQLKDLKSKKKSP